MVKAIRDMKQRMNEVDVVIETRDARLPLTSINPVFEEILKGPSVKNRAPSASSSSPVRLVVYNKKDLADPRLEKVCCRCFSLVSLENQVLRFWLIGLSSDEG
jgi:ribosome biogenesis GTPase A